MLNNKTNNIVCMDTKSNKGYTLISVLLTLFIIMISLPFVGYLLKNSSTTKQYEDIAVQQFFIFLRNEIIYATDVYIEDNILFLRTKDDELAKMELYKNLIRRQVKGGHEVYLRDVADFKLESLPFGGKVTVITDTGGMYEKKMVFN